MNFRVIADTGIDEVNLRLDAVNLVQGENYNQDVPGWTFDVSVR
jgi:hypothetical protein